MGSAAQLAAAVAPGVLRLALRLSFLGKEGLCVATWQAMGINILPSVMKNDSYIYCLSDSKMLVGSPVRYYSSEVFAFWFCPKPFLMVSMPENVSKLLRPYWHY